MKRILTLLVLLLPVAGVAAPVPFSRLKALVGEWEAKSEKGAPIRVSYRLMANDSVLVEDWQPQTSHETLTLFHADGARVILTHYCMQGNQPRLELHPSSTEDRLLFTFVDATNLRSGAAHMVRLEIKLDGPDRFLETETYDEGGKSDVTTLRFQRVK